MRSPPLSPSTKAVTVFLLLNLPIIGDIFVPSTAIVFLIPYLSRFNTSARPSTIIIASEFSMFGPAGKSLYFVISSILTASFTSFTIISLSMPFSVALRINSFARAVIIFLFVALMSSTLQTSTFAIQGPTLSMVSKEAANIAVSTLSRPEGISISPFDFPLFDSILTSILPILLLFCKSLRSSSSPNNPSV